MVHFKYITNKTTQEIICNKLIKTDNLWSLLNLISLDSSLALLIIGISICFEKIKLKDMKMKKNNDILSCFKIDVNRHKQLKIKQNK